jgi:arylsulfatase A-like enzyme
LLDREKKLYGEQRLRTSGLAYRRSVEMPSGVPTVSTQGRFRALLLSTLLLGLALALGCDLRDAGRFNLLLIAVDTLRADHLGAHGYERPTSPHIDRFFSEAIVFDDAHSTSSWTLPAFASLMTSTYSSTHECWQFESQLDSSFTTLAEVLRGAGYHTAAVTSHTFLGSSYGLGQGFEDYDESLIRALRRSHLAISSPPVTKRALAFLDRQAHMEERRPWFLWAHYFDPHKHYNEHPGVTGEFGSENVDLYDGEIAFTDAHIGQLLDRLSSTGFVDDTVVVIMADHGEEFGDHGGANHGLTLFREVERVPLAIRVPGLPPRRVTDTVSLVDFMPTILDLLEIETPKAPMAGRSLLALMRGGRMASRGALLESRLRLRRDANLEAYVTGRWKLIVEIPRGIRWKPGKRPARTKIMLFDRVADPGETRDVAAEHADVVAELMQRLDDSLASARSDANFFVAAPAQDLSEETIDALRALGYVGDETGQDAKDDSLGE